MTDFGVANDAVAICKGVMWSINPDLRIVDLTHQVTPYSILDGARFLAGASPYYPSGTVFVGVIDPGVGSARKAVVVKSKRGQYFVLPDNGLITLVEDRDGVEGAREISNPSWMRGDAISSTFHGRDIFSPVGAHLAHGEDWTQVGPEIEVRNLVRLSIPEAKTEEKGIAGEIIALDDPEVAAALHFLHDHAGEPIGVGDLVNQLMISRRSLEIRFRRTIGRTIRDELQRLRLERAKRLLRETDLPITRVATGAGFTSPSYLAQVFHQSFGVTPARYRRQVRTPTT